MTLRNNFKVHSRLYILALFSYRSIYLSGGVTLLPGFAERLQSELQAVVPPTIKVQVRWNPIFIVLLLLFLLFCHKGGHVNKLCESVVIYFGSYCTGQSPFNPRSVSAVFSTDNIR